MNQPWFVAGGLPMICPTCRTELHKRYKYDVKGLRYGTLPGMVHVYWCQLCRQKIRYVEIRENDLKEWAAQWEERRQEWIRERANLKQQLYWMGQPATYAERRLVELRAKLITLIEHTF